MGDLEKGYCIRPYFEIRTNVRSSENRVILFGLAAPGSLGS
jgi:hypothetical protein